MLETQKYILNNSLEQIQEELKIKVIKHPTLNNMILNYNQIESPKTHPVVRECRGLVLKNNSFDYVARGFQRFYNYGETDDQSFDFSDFITQTKEDGSLILIYKSDGLWHAHTRGSFALEEITNGIKWQELILNTLKINNLQELDAKLDGNFTYVCELCSIYNKIVRTYLEPKMFLLSMFDKNAKELHWSNVPTIDLFHPVEKHHFSSYDEIQNFIKEQEKNDKTFEGVVIRDCENRRWKVKSSTYLALHHMKGEGTNMFMPKYLIEFALTGETDEVLTYFPEIKDQLKNVQDKLTHELGNLLTLWQEAKDIESQKDFALYIIPKTKLSSILFQARKEKGDEGTIINIWENSKDLLLKILF